MSTRSLIAHEDMETGRIKSIYCHFDGYLEGVGKTLLEHWQSQGRVQSLIRLGDLSQLGTVIGKKHDFDYQMRFYDKYKPEGKSFGTDQEAMNADPEYQRLKAMCLAYGRDRGEPDCEAKEHENEQAYFEYGQESWSEYLYLYRQGVWLYCEPGGEAGPFLVTAENPDGAEELIWKSVAGMLDLGEKPRRYLVAA